MKVFLDTNALIYFAHDDGYVFPSEFELITFEKCVYEFGLGFKSRLLDQEFIIHSIKGKPLQSDKIEQQFIVEVVSFHPKTLSRADRDSVVEIQAH